MSLPNYLAKIKSAGIYRFVWDKSQIPPQQAETLRLVVGYSEKGIFNTPVYLESASDFTAIYGNISKRLERKGVYFHRLAQQALQAGPILALNVKPFTESTDEVSGEKIQFINFNAQNDEVITPASLDVCKLYDTNRFWALDADQLPEKVGGLGKYMTIATTDVKDNSCSIFMRKVEPVSYKNVTFHSWFTSLGEEMPEYLEPIQNESMHNYFMEIYVFRGKFTPELCSSDQLKKYFKVEGDTVTLNLDYTNSLGEKVDVLESLASNANSNFVGVYSGITLPYFKDANNNYISIDLKFNADNYSHKMLMKMDEADIEGLTAEELKEKIQMVDDVISPIYLEGYTYSTIDKTSSMDDIYEKCMGQMTSKGILEALTNRVDVEYHYIVDTFDSSVTNSKAAFYALAKKKDNAFAIVNFPKMSLFANDSTLKSNVTGVFDINNISKKYTLPGDSEGASYGACYSQLVFSDGTVKSVIPSAALVSNLFMEKWGARQPYYIVAGPTFGRISYSGLVGPDYNFGRSDLDVLEPMGVNAIIYVPRKGTYINSNQTAKQAPVSGLSKIHIRELVIYLQNEVENLLQSYQWELNTQTLRDTIKSKADAICETIMNNGGLYAYKNICDETNNTPEVIDNEMIILDTEIEPARGAGKMVHQLTIHKTGALSSSVK